MKESLRGGAEKGKENEEFYDAFISYRHEALDSYVAEQLHKMLEHYHIPRPIQEISGKKKIGRIFRDKEELALSSALSDNIKQALMHSEYLIVVCSPAASKSEWIRREIEYFSFFHSPDHILLVLADGEPEDAFPEMFLCSSGDDSFEDAFSGDIFSGEDSGDTSSGQEPDSFPGIYPIGPLAADVRGADRKVVRKKLKQELPRLLAPMLSCKYDELRRRHREYRRNRILAAAAGAVSVIVLTAGVMFFQWGKFRQQQRSALEAQARYQCKTSQELLDSGDREGAIKAAGSLFYEEDGERKPYVMEQFYALNNALYSYQAPESYFGEFCPGQYYPVKKVDLDCMDRENGLVNPEGTIYMDFREKDGQETVFFMDTDLEKLYWEFPISKLTGSLSEEIVDGYLLEEKKAVLFTEKRLFYLDIVNQKILYCLDMEDCIQYEAGNRYVIAVYEKKGSFSVRIFDLESGTWSEKSGVLLICEPDEEKQEMGLTDVYDKILIVQDEINDRFFLSVCCESESTVVEYSMRQKKVVSEFTLDSIVYAMIPDRGSHLAVLEHYPESSDTIYRDFLLNEKCESFLSIYDTETAQWISRREHCLYEGFDYAYDEYDHYGLLFWDNVRSYSDHDPNFYDWEKWEETRSVYVVWLDNRMMLIDSESGKILEELSGESDFLSINQIDVEKILLCCEDGSISCRNLNGYARDYSKFDLNSTQIETAWFCYCPKTGNIIQAPREAYGKTRILFSQISDEGYTSLNIPDLEAIYYMTLYTEEKTVVYRVGRMDDPVSGDSTYTIWDGVPADENMLCSQAVDYEIKKHRGRLCLCYSAEEDPSQIHVMDLETRAEVVCAPEKDLQLTEDDSFSVVYTKSSSYTSLEEENIYAVKRPLVLMPMGDKNVQVVDQEKKETILTIPVSGVSSVKAVFYKEDTMLILADNGNQTIALWDLEQKEMVSWISGNQYVGEIFAGDGPYFAAVVPTHLRDLVHIYYADESNQISNYAYAECSSLNLDAQEMIYSTYSGVTGYCHFYSFEELLEKAEKILGKGALTAEED